MNAEARKVLDRIHSDIPADVLLGRLTFEQRKLVELARAVWNDPEILIIDETTTALRYVYKRQVRRPDRLGQRR